MAAVNSELISTTLKYKWRIPSLSTLKKYLLCDAYIRMNYHKYITTAIIKLCALYYTNDPYSLQDIKERTQPSFQSPIISMQGLKWYFELKIDSDDVICTAYMIAFPHNAKHFNVLSILKAAHISPQSDPTALVLNKYGHSIINNEPFKLSDITHLQQLCIDFELDILSVFGKNNNRISNYFDKCMYGITPIQLPMVDCTWTISKKLQLQCIQNATKRTYLLSPIYKFGVFRFCLKFYPNVKNGSCICYLAILGFPMGIKQISVHGILCLKETETMCYITDRIFTLSSNSWGWRARRLKYTEIKKLKEVTLTTQFSIVEVYENDTDFIPNYVEEFALKYPKMTSTITPMFDWKISNLKMLRKREPGIDEVFDEKVIEIGPLKWHLTFIPKPKHSKTAKFTLTLCHFPSNLLRMWFAFRSTITELNELKDSAMWFDRKHTLLNWSITATMDCLIKMNEFVWRFGAEIINVTGIHSKDIEKYARKYPNPIKECLVNNKLSQEFVWRIRDKKVLNGMFYAANVVVHTSRIFILHGLKWSVSFYPCGSNTKREQTYNLFLKSVGIESGSYFVKWEMEFIETGVIQCGYWMVDKNNNNRGMVSNSSRIQETKQLENLHSFTIKIRIKMIDVYNINCNFIANNCKIYEPKLEIYTWYIWYGLMERMKNAINGEIFESDIFYMFGMRWYLSCYPFGTNEDDNQYVVLCINNVTLLPDINAVLSVKYKLCVKETGTILSGCCYLDSETRNTSWGPYRISTETFKTLNHLTIKLQLSLIENESNNYKYNPDNRIMNVSVIKSNENELKLWFANQLGLPQYYNVFIRNGIDTMGMLKLITFNDLDAMNINKIQHKTRMLIEITKLNL